MNKKETKAMNEVVTILKEICDGEAHQLLGYLEIIKHGVLTLGAEEYIKMIANE